MSARESAASKPRRRTSKDWTDGFVVGAAVANLLWVLATRLFF